MSDRCPVCDCGEAVALFSSGDRFFPSGETYPLSRCGDCGLVYLPDEGDRVEDFYPEAYSENRSKDCGLAARLRSRAERLYFDAAYRSRLRKLRRLAVDAKTLLDVGCGGGEFVRLFARAGCEALGIEMLSYGGEGERGGARVVRGDFGHCELAPESYDVATMYNSLEHFQRPLEALRKVRGLLKPRGFLMVQVPNIESLQSRLFKGRWFAIEAPRHRVHFSPKTLGVALEKAGFEVERVSHYCLRDSAAALASSLSPTKAPITLKGLPKSEWMAWASDLAYAFLLGPAFLAALVEAMLGKGGSIMATARKAP